MRSQTEHLDQTPTRHSRRRNWLLQYVRKHILVPPHPSHVVPERCVALYVMQCFPGLRDVRESAEGRVEAGIPVSHIRR